MKAKVVFSNNIIKVKSSKWNFGLIAILGVILFGTGMYIHGAIFPQDHLLIGIGLIFASGGLFFFQNSKYYKILINDEPGYISIIESSYRTINPIKIPITYYTCISVQKKIDKNSPKDSQNKNYEISLINIMGSELHIAEFANHNRAMEFAKKLQDIIHIDLVFEDNAIQMILQNKNKSIKSLDIPIPLKTKLKKEDDGTLTILNWKNRQNILYYCFLLIIIYGFFHIFHFVVIPEQKYPIISYLIYGFFCLILLLILYIIIVNIFGTFYLHISPNGIKYYTKIIGNYIGEREINKNSIGLIKNSLNMSNNSITIITKNGMNIISRLLFEIKKDNNLTADFSLISDIMALRDEILDINAASLLIAEKLFIENEILKKIR